MIEENLREHLRDDEGAVGHSVCARGDRIAPGP